MLNIRVAGNSTLCSSLQAWEIWQCHGAWVRENKPGFGPGIKERFEMAASITQEVRGAGADAFPVMLRDSFSRTLTLPTDELFVAYCLCYQNLTVPASCVLPPPPGEGLEFSKEERHQGAPLCLARGRWLPGPTNSPRTRTLPRDARPAAGRVAQEHDRPHLHCRIGRPAAGAWVAT